MESTLIRLSEDQWSAEYLAELAGHSDHEIRILVADTSMTPLAVLEMLAEDDHPDVRYAMAENHNMPAHILRILIQDENPYVADRARRTLSRSDIEPLAYLRYIA